MRPARLVTGRLGAHDATFAAPHLVNADRQVLSVEQRRVAQSPVHLVKQPPRLACTLKITHQQQDLVQAPGI